MKKYDFGILPAELDGRSRLWMQVFDSNRISDHFLDEVDVKVIGYRLGTATTHRHSEPGARVALIHQFKKVAYTIGLLGQVPSIIGEEKSAVGIENRNFRRRRTDIDTQFPFIAHEISVATVRAVIMRDS